LWRFRRKDDQVAALEDRVQRLENDNLEERFVWFLILLILFDTLIFMNMQNLTGPIVIGLIELLAVLVMAHRCKVDTVAPLIDKLVGAYGTNPPK